MNNFAKRSFISLSDRYVARILSNLCVAVAFLSLSISRFVPFCRACCPLAFSGCIVYGMAARCCVLSVYLCALATTNGSEDLTYSINGY